MQTLTSGIVLHPIGRDWDRYYERDLGRGNPYQSDADLWQEMISLATAADQFGYDYAFAPEHHVSPYGMCTDPLQVMTFIAGRTRNIGLGTSVAVLPWHHPLRVAEQISLLDNLAPDRKKIIGVGRGVAQFEYAALGVPYDDRRERFDEAVDIIRLALTRESFSYDGEIFQIPEVTLRPKPVNPNIYEDLHVAATGDETLVEGARRGLGLIYAGQKSAGLTRSDVEMLNAERIGAGFEAAQPVLLTWLSCAPSEQEARERMARATSGLLFDLVNNYAQAVWDMSDRAPGYDAFVSAQQTNSTPENWETVETFIERQIYGTPEQCLEKVKALQEATGAKNVSFQVQYGDITHAEALASTTLFATEALDKLHTIPTPIADWMVPAKVSA